MSRIERAARQLPGGPIDLTLLLASTLAVRAPGALLNAIRALCELRSLFSFNLALFGSCGLVEATGAFLALLLGAFSIAIVRPPVGHEERLRIAVVPVDGNKNGGGHV